MTAAALRHPLLEAHGVEHGFGLRGFEQPPGLRRPKQVHGTAVISFGDCVGATAPEADAIVSAVPGRPIGIVTADCVPVLLADPRAGVVAAIHAGWRGLATGVIACGATAFERSGGDVGGAIAVVGPHIGVCCYEVDRPVLDAISGHFGEPASAAMRSTIPGHALLDLGWLANDALRSAGFEASHIGSFSNLCTACDADRFDSYRRDGARSGRMVHFISAGEPRKGPATSRNRGQNQG